MPGTFAIEETRSEAPEPAWDGVPCMARQCVVEVLHPHGGGPPPKAWYRDLIGTERYAVEVVVPEGVSDAVAVGLGQTPGRVLYIDDADGWGWAKVTWKRGHRGVVSGIFHRVRVLGYFD